MDPDEDDNADRRPQRRRRAAGALADWLDGVGRLVVARSVADVGFTGGHFHPVPEVFLQIAGRARFILAGQTIVLDPGALLLMPAGVAHDERDLGGSLNLVVKLIGGRCQFHLGEGAVCILPDAVASDLAPFANRALGDAASVHSDDAAHALALVVAWAHQIRHLLASHLPSVGSSDPASRALLFISEPLADADLGAAVVAAHVGLSIDHCCRRFRAATGSTVQTFRASTDAGAYAAAIPKFVNQALDGQAIHLFGDGKQTRDFSFVKNTVTANLLAADCSKKLSGEIVNIAGERRVELLGLVEEIGRRLAQSTQGSPPVEVIHDPPRAGDIRHSLGDITRARELLGFAPLVRWEEGLPSTIEYLRTLRKEGRSAASAVMSKLWA